MGLSSLLTRRRTAGLAAALLTGGVLLAQAAPAVAAPAPTPAPGATSTSAAPSVTTSTSGPVTGSTSATSPAATGSTGSTGHVAKPAATAPPVPVDPGPACTTNAGALYPVVCLPAGSGEDRPAAATAGDYLEFDAQVVNDGPPVADASVTITLPKGLSLESDEDDPVYRIDGWFDDTDGDFTDLSCTGGPSTVTCQVGPLATGANILIGFDLQVDEDAVPGSTLDFRVELQPVGTPTYDPTSVTASVVVLQPTKLVVSLAPAGLHVVVGHRATVTGTVRNAGVGPAPDTVAIAVAVDPQHPRKTHFVIVNGQQVPVDDPSDDPSDGSGEVSISAAPVAAPAGGARVAVLAARGASTLRSLLQRHALGRSTASVQRHSLPSIAFWPIGTLAPGAVAHVSLQLKAVTAGSDMLTFGAVSGEEDQECDELGGSGGGSTSEAVPTIATMARAAAASSTTAPAGCSFVVQTRITAVNATAALANTGAHGLDTEVGIAVWAVVLGAGLVWAGRRRRSATGLHQI